MKMAAEADTAQARADEEARQRAEREAQERKQAEEAARLAAEQAEAERLRKEQQVGGAGEGRWGGVALALAARVGEGVGRWCAARARCWIRTPLPRGAVCALLVFCFPWPARPSTHCTSSG